jgi:APA family basic amino acid/polyamine antiporter
VAWGYWISIWCANAALGVALVSYLGYFVPALVTSPWMAMAVVMTAVWLLTWVNVRGVREAGAVQLGTTILKLLPLVAVATLGLAFIDLDNFRPFNVSGTSDFTAVTATAALTLWAFLGFESATVPAEEVHDPERTIARATVVGTVFTGLIYILATVVVMGVIPSDILARSTAPFGDAAAAMWGSWAGWFVAAGAVVSCFGALNGWILLQGRIPFAAARDGLFPAAFARLSPRGTPTFGLVFSSFLVTLLLMLNFGAGLVEQFTFIILLATLTALLPYCFSTMAQLMLSIREPERYRDQRTPGRVIVAILGFFYSLWAIAGAGQRVVFWGTLLLLAGIPVYVWVVWRRSPAGKSSGLDRARDG